MKEVHFSRAVKEVQFGAWVFDLKRQVIFDNEVEKELEPLLFKLLSYLIINKGEILTRDDLSSDVWGQNYVDDNAINRAISELRKLLKSEQQKGIVIKTHHRKGYSFFLEPKIIYEEEPHVAPEISINKPQTNTINNKVVNKKNKKFKLSLIFCVFMMFVVGGTYFNNNNSISVTNVDHEETVLSWISGQYSDVVISPNKEMVLFAFIPSNNKNKQLVVKNLQTGEEKKLVSSKASYTPIGWAHDSMSLFYQIKTDSICEVGQINSDFEGNNKKSFSCNGDIRGGVGIENDRIIFAKSGYRGKNRLFALTNRDLKTGEEFQISSPNLNSTTGDKFLYYSDYLKTIFFVRYHHNYRELYMTDIEGGAQKKLHTLNGRISSLNYNELTNNIIWIDTQTNKVTEFSLDKNKIIQEKKLPKDHVAFLNTSILSNKALIATSYPFSQNIYTYDFNKLFPIIERNHIDYNGIIGDEKLYFLSPSSGNLDVNLFDLKTSKIIKLNSIESGYKSINYIEHNNLLLLVYKGKINIYNNNLEIKDTLNDLNNIIYVTELEKGNIAVITLDENKITSKVHTYSNNYKRKTTLPVSNIKKIEQLNEETYVFLNNINELIFFDINSGKQKSKVKLENSNVARKASTHLIAINKNTLYYSDGFSIYTIDEEKKWQLIYKGRKGKYILNMYLSERHNKLVLSMYERKENQLLKLTL